MGESWFMHDMFPDFFLFVTYSKKMWLFFFAYEMNNPCLFVNSSWGKCTFTC